MDYEKCPEGILLRQEDFELSQTLDCGQAFRWSCIEEGVYTGNFLRRFLRISSCGKNTFMLHDITEDEFLSVWKDYFDLETDYGELKKRFSEDSILSQACSFAPGIRLLRQDAWETLCSFIISQNNNIPRIKGIISRLCEKYGGFPESRQLAGETAETLSFLRAGFRARYIEDAALKTASGEVDLEKIRSMPYEDAKKALMDIKGVGPKVADCVLLYGMYRTQAFPMDVWMKRVMESFYPDGMPSCTKGVEGIAQQYLFHYVRSVPDVLKFAKTIE
jgi:N-glycosylase/DNA lyase